MTESTSRYQQATHPADIQNIISSRLETLADKLTDLAQRYSQQKEFAHQPLRLYVKPADQQWGQALIAPAMPGPDFEAGPLIPADLSTPTLRDVIHQHLKDLSSIVPGQVFHDDQDINAIGAVVVSKVAFGVFPIVAGGEVLESWRVAEHMQKDDTLFVQNGAISLREYDALVEQTMSLEKELSLDEATLTSKARPLTSDSEYSASM